MQQLHDIPWGKEGREEEREEERESRREGERERGREGGEGGREKGREGEREFGALQLTLCTSLNPPLPSRYSIKYLSFKTGFSLNLHKKANRVSHNTKLQAFNIMYNPNVFLDSNWPKPLSWTLASNEFQGKCCSSMVSELVKAGRLSQVILHANWTRSRDTYR